MQQQPDIKYLQRAFCKSYPGRHLQLNPFLSFKRIDWEYRVIYFFNIDISFKRIDWEYRVIYFFNIDIPTSWKYYVG